MKRSRKSFRVSWAPGVNLCQERKFLSDDCPSRVGAPALDHLQKKFPELQNIDSKDWDDVAPGFEGYQCLHSSKVEVTWIPRIQWRCSPKLVVRSDWRIAAGEESQEAGTQKLRETKVLEAVYPRLSSVPPCPDVSLGVEGESYDDSITPIVPLIPIEELEEEVAMDISLDLSAPSKTPIISQSPTSIQNHSLSGISDASPYSSSPALESSVTEKSGPVKLPSSGADIVTAALTAAMKITEQGSLIDTELLVKIISDPKMIEKLIKGQEPEPTLPMASSQSVSNLSLSSCSIPSSAFPSISDRLSSLNTFVTLTDTLSLVSTVTSASPSVNASFVSVPTVMQPSVATMPALSGNVSESGAKIEYQSTGIHPWPSVGSLNSLGNPVKPSIRQMPIPRNSFATVAVSNLRLHQNFNAAGSGAPITQPITQPIPIPRRPVAPPAGNSWKDIDYIKNLIKEHGGVKHETQNGMQYNHLPKLDMVNKVKLKEVKAMFNKPCMYFKTARGCRKGTDCPFQHELPHQLRTGSSLEPPCEKRIRYSNGYESFGK